MGDADAMGPALHEASAALRRLPRTDGSWAPRYDVRPRPAQVPPVAPPETPPDAAPDAPPGDDGPPRSQVFEPDAKAEKHPDAATGVAEILAASERLAELGAEKYRDTLAEELPIEHRLAMTACGLDDDALTREAAAPGTEPAMLLDGPPPADVATRARRLCMLLRRVPTHDAPPLPSDSTVGTPR
jgi:hypothetical protein